MNKIGEYQVACSRYATSAGSILKVITTLNLPVWDKLYVNRLRQFQSFMTITCSTTPHLVVDENDKHFHLHARHFELRSSYQRARMPKICAQSATFHTLGSTVTSRPRSVCPAALQDPGGMSTCGLGFAELVRYRLSIPRVVTNGGSAEISITGQGATCRVICDGWKLSKLKSIE